MSTAYQWGMVVGILVGVIIVALIFTYNKRKTGTVNGGEYDERQKLLRGKAFQKGFFAMAIFCVLYWALVMLIAQRPLMEDGLSCLLCVFLGIGVFGIDCVVHDAFFTVQNKPKSYIALFTASSLCQVPSAIDNLRDGEVAENGVLTFGVVPIVCFVLFMSVLAAILLKQLAARKEEE